MIRTATLLLDGGIVLDSEETLSLLLHTCCAALAGGLRGKYERRKRAMWKGTYLVLDTAGLRLVCEDLCASLLGFSFVDELHQHTLVLENVTLGLLVKDVVPAHDNPARSAIG